MLGDFARAIQTLDDVLKFIDGAPGPNDWIVDGEEKTAIRVEVELIIILLEIEL